MVNGFRMGARLVDDSRRFPQFGTHRETQLRYGPTTFMQ